MDGKILSEAERVSPGFVLNQTAGLPIHPIQIFKDGIVVSGKAQVFWDGVNWNVRMEFSEK